MTRRTLWIGLFAMAVLPVAQAQSDIEKQFIGTWRLVGAAQKLANGTSRPSPAYGPNQLGYMIYTETKQICSVTVNADRPKWASGRPTAAELESSWEGFGSYCGTFTINAEEKSITHHVEFDKSPNAAGSDRKRFYRFEGSRLVLRIPGETRGDVVENTVTWERVTK